MRRMMFAIKLPVKEKMAMDYISIETGEPLSRIFYDVIKVAVEETLGNVLIFRADLSTRPDIPVQLPSRDEDIPPPQIVREFDRLMETRRKEFQAIFSKYDFASGEDFIYEIDMRKVARSVGKEYLEIVNDFEVVDMRLVREVIFTVLLYEYFIFTAVGPLKELEHVWRSRKREIDAFRDGLLKDYTDLYEHVVEIVEVMDEKK